MKKPTKKSGLTIAQRPSPNFNERKIEGGPSFIIIHYTNMTSAEAAIDRLCDPAAEVSAHYLIDHDGTITQMVEEGSRAWHAGVSFWDGVHDLNSHSIGIELDNPGHAHGYRSFPARQMTALIQLCRDIKTRHPIRPDRVLGHSDIAPSRPDKIDPGILFDWPTLANAGIGLYPAPDELDYDTATELVGNRRWLASMLKSYGYGPDASFAENVTAFQRHFHPTVFRAPEDVGHPDLETIARLSSLLRQKEEAAIVPPPDGRTAVPARERKVRASRKHGAG